MLRLGRWSFHVGFPLAKLLALVEPTSKAKYVAFETRYAPEQMPGQKVVILVVVYRTPMLKGYA